MSNLLPRDTGVDAVLWFSAGEFDEAGSDLGPRLLVTTADVLSADALRAAVAVRLTDPPELLGSLPEPLGTQAIAFAVEHRRALLRHWHLEIDTMQTLVEMRLLKRSRRAEKRS